MIIEPINLAGLTIREAYTVGNPRVYQPSKLILEMTDGKKITVTMQLECDESGRDYATGEVEIIQEQL